MVVYTSFKDQFSFNKRAAESLSIRSLYPDRIPIIVQTSKSSSLPPLERNKYLVPRNLTCGAFMSIIRKKIKSIGPEQALFLIYGNNSMMTSSRSVAQAYDDCADEDGNLYVFVSKESVFGERVRKLNPYKTKFPRFCLTRR